MKRINKNLSGFTLIEILVALAIGSIILAGVVQVFLGSKQAETLTMSLARIQENGRFAVEALNKDLRLTGYQGCSDPQLDFIDPVNIQANNFNFNLTQQPISGASVPVGGGPVGLYGGALVIPDAAGNTDIVSVTYASPEFEQLSINMPLPNSVITIAGNSAGFSATDVLLISNCTALGQYIFQASSVSGSGPVTIAHNSTGNSSASFGVAFFADHFVYKLVQYTYYIKENPRGIRALYRRSLSGTVSELIEGVEDMKVVYGHYDDNNTDDSGADDNVSWVDGDTINSTPSLEWKNVSSIKVALLIADDTEVLSASGPASYNLLGIPVPPITTDRKIRRVFSTSAKIRNRDGKRISL